MSTERYHPSAALNPARLRTRDVLGFLAFSHGWTWCFWMVAGLLGESVWEFPGIIFFYIGGAGVFVGGLAMSWLVYGSVGIKELIRRIIDPRRVAGRWWAVILLLFPVLALLAAAMALLTGVSHEPFDLTGALHYLAHPAQLFVFATFILIIGPLPEEIGWRGYLLDRLQLRWSALAASLLLAVIWWSWHLPLFVLPGYFEAFGHAPPSPLDFLYGIVPAAILYTWVYNNTDRSVLAVILLHFMQNFTGELLGMSPEVRSLQLVLMTLVAVIVVLWWGPATLIRSSAKYGETNAPERRRKE